MKIVIGCDQNAYKLKLIIMNHLKDIGIEYVDFGCYENEEVLYPNVALKVANGIGKGEFERGILLCGTGIGMCITANKVPGARAAVCHDVYSAERARKSNNAQILCMGSEILGPALAKKLVDIWLSSEFQGGKSKPKVDLIEEIDRNFRIEI
ncbi:ribose 5-phosphate isomerase B [Clostridium sp. MSJ-11]|uniref:Ribose 5-phosphate isomerase B n=1 Tax=Clostridium mobile TaxID=2841512 RepID=A0ABS6EFY7_9CLOT|nr:ribose 5-phosphate isomerase B [Clostridium mobile]MBU5483920.1 ribose 5-phosphate isomerase B [Clostridium mobile]